MASVSLSGPAPSRRIALAFPCAGQSDQQFLTQALKITLYPAFAADQHMIGIFQTLDRQNIPEQGAKPALHPVANHRIADSFGHGDAKTHALAAIGTGQQHETGTRNSQAAIGGKEIGPAGQDFGFRRHDWM